MKPISGKGEETTVGNQDFVSIRKNDCFYIDKTDFIREWWEN